MQTFLVLLAIFYQSTVASCFVLDRNKCTSSCLVNRNGRTACDGHPEETFLRTSSLRRQPPHGRTLHILKVSTNGEVSNTGLSEGATPLSSSITENLEALGWQPHFANQLPLDDDDNNNSEPQNKTPDLTPLRVTEVRSKTIHAVGAHGVDWLIPITAGQKIKNNNDEKVVVAGDWILVERSEEDIPAESEAVEGSPPRICTILQRNSVLKRRAPGRNTRKAQLIAANLDTVFVVSSCNQDFNVARLERYIAMVLETENVMPVIVLTKKDLLELADEDELGDENYHDCSEDDDDEGEDYDGDVADDDGKKDTQNGDNDEVEAYADDIGDYGDEDDDDDIYNDDDDLDLSSSWLLDYYIKEATSIAGGSIPVVCLDARDRDQATALLAPWLGPGQTVAFVGSSGVGKSTLANTLCDREVAPTGDIHTDSGQGRHTTTRRQLHFVRHENGESSGAILDTPGLRELQLVDASQGLGLVFSDLVELSKECKFKDCRHEGEPGCAIAHAVEQGDVDPYRVARWEKLVAEEKRNSDEVADGKKERERKKRLKEKQKLSSRRRKNTASEE